MSRELIAKAFGLGCINVSPKVSSSLSLYIGPYLFFQEFDKAVSDALEYAKTRRPQARGREGLGLAREGEVCCPLGLLVNLVVLFR